MRECRTVMAGSLASLLAITAFASIEVDKRSQTFK
jgi:hypothetical protein